MISRSHLVFYVFSAVAFLFCFYYFSEIRSDFQQLERVKAGWLVVAIAAQVFTYLFAAFIYHVLLRAFRVKPLPGTVDLVEASVIFLFFNQAVPSVGVSGNTFFFHFLIKRKIPPGQAISFMATELFIFYATMVVVTWLLLVVCSFLKMPAYFLAVLAAGVAIHLLLAVVIFLLGRKRSLNFVYRKIKKLGLFKKTMRNFRQKTEQSNSGRTGRLLVFLKKNKPVVLNVFLLQVMVLAADGFTLVALFYGLGVPVSVFAVGLGFICTRVISTLPIAPGSLILYESSMTFFLVRLGVAVGPAVVVTLLYRLLSFWLPMPVGLFLYRKWLKKTG